MERERQLAERMRQREAEKEKEPEKPKLDPKAEYEKLLSMRSGGTYIPPARLRALQAQITDKNSKEYQRMAWEALKKSINGLINKVNVSNIKHIVPELFGENLIRGRGLYCRSIMKAQAASLPFTAIYAAMTAIVNTKLPQVGELLLNRLVVQFRKAFKRNDKAVCLSSTTFIAHLCNQQVANEILAIEILMLLLDKPTDDSVEIAVGLMREVGAHLEQMSPPANNAVYEQFRTILHEASIDKRSQYMVEVLFQVRKDKYKDHPIIREELDLVEEEDQITHRTELDDEIDTADGLNVFKFDPDWEEHEELYRKTKAEILGEGSEGESDEEEDDDSSDEEDEEKQEDKKIEIQDQTNTNLVNLRRTIYLTIMSSVDFEECCHKLMKVYNYTSMLYTIDTDSLDQITLPPGLEKELCLMVIECCSQERTYSKFYGLIGERFAKLNRLWTELFEDCFRTYYDTIHRYETNRLRNIARFFGHQLSSDALGWHVLSVVHINEEETTSSSRIFVKILFQDLAECMGMKKLQERLKDPFLQNEYTGLFPKDNPRNTRFSINYFTSIGMGGVTEDMREHLKNNVEAQAAIAPPPPAGDVSDNSSVSSRSSYSSYSGSSRSRSRSRSGSYDSRSRSRSRGRASKGKGKARSYTRSLSGSDRSRSRSRSHSLSKSYDSYSHRSKSYSRSRSRSLSPYAKNIKRERSVSRGSGSSRSRSRSRSRSYTPAKKEAIESRGRRRSRSYSSSIDVRSRKPIVRGRSYSSASRSPSHSSRSPTPKRSVKSRKDSYSPPPRSRRRSPTPGDSRSRSRSPTPVRSPIRERDSGKWDRYDGRRGREDNYRRNGGRDRGHPRYGRDSDARRRTEGPAAETSEQGGRGAGRVRAADFL